MTPPLEGVRVLDLSRALSGPFCTMVLADLGADVVKVEPLGNGEMIRGWGPYTGDISVYYLSTNRNKRSLALDMRTQEGLRLLRRLAVRSDVLVENFRPGTLERMGLRWSELSAQNPGLILTSVTGFGGEGPYASWASFDQIAQGMSGLMSLTGTAETGPLRAGLPIGDLAASLWAALGTVSALFQKSATGQGQRVETSLLAGLVSLLCVQGQRQLTLGDTPGPIGNEHPVICPYGTFEAADGPLNIAAATPEMWRRLCHLLELDDLPEHEDFRDNNLRMRNRDRLAKLLNARLAGRTRSEWTQRLAEAGIPAGPIYDLSEVFVDPQVRQSNLVEEVEHPTLGKLTQLASGVRLACHAEGTVRRPPPMLGEDSEAVLADYGIAGAEIERLVRDGIVGTWEGAADHPGCTRPESCQGAVSSDSESS